MSLIYSNTTSPTLPGAPMTDAERNARAKVDDIAAAFELVRCANSQFGLERDALSYDAISLLGDISWDADDGLDVRSPTRLTNTSASSPSASAPTVTPMTA